MNLNTTKLPNLKIILLVNYLVAFSYTTFAQQAFQLYRSVGELNIVCQTISNQKLYGIADDSNNLLTEIKYTAPPKIAKSPHIKLHKVQITNTHGKKLYGLINRKGQEIANCVYDEISNRLDYDYILLKKDGKYGMINQKGAIITPFEYDQILLNYPLKADKAYVFKKGNKFGLLLLTGEIVVDAQFNAIEYYDNNQHFTIIKEDKIGYLNQKGAFFLSPSPEFLPIDFPENMAVCEQEVLKIAEDCKTLDCSLSTAEKVINSHLKSKIIDEEEIKIIRKGNKLYWTYETLKITKEIKNKPCSEIKQTTYFFSVKTQKMVKKKREKKLRCLE